MNEKTYASQEVIFTKGDPSEFAYLINSGEVEILDNYPETPVRLAILGPGEILGEMGLVDERPRSLTARALQETEVTTITRDQFIDLVLYKPEEAFKYLRMFFERLRAMNMRLAHSADASDTNKAIVKNLAVRMSPETGETAQVIANEGFTLEKFPFRVGRETHHRKDPLDVNDLLLPDQSPYNVSRNHFAIEKNDDGVFVHDRGSYLGTIVNGKSIGGHHKEAWTSLEVGRNKVVAGTAHSPYRFLVDIEEI